VTTSPEKAFVEPGMCDGCERCIGVCPSKAITLTDGRADIDPFLCSGCGGCVPECPAGAIGFRNATEKQVVAALRGVLRDKGPGEVRLVAFVEGTIAYTGVDFLGLDRLAYPASVRVVEVPSTALIGLGHLLHAFALGADGVVMIEGRHDIDEMFTKRRINPLKEGLDERGIDGTRLWYSLVELPSYKNIAGILALHAKTVEELGPLDEELLEGIRGRLRI